MPDMPDIYDHPNGVVFYQLSIDEVPIKVAVETVVTIAEQMAVPVHNAPAFVVRLGIRENKKERTYWLSLNSAAAGQMFEGTLMRLRARVIRKKGLPEGFVPRPLEAVLTHLEGAMEDPGVDAVELADEYVDGTAEEEAPRGLKARIAAAKAGMNKMRGRLPSRGKRA